MTSSSPTRRSSDPPPVAQARPPRATGHGEHPHSAGIGTPTSDDTPAAPRGSHHVTPVGAPSHGGSPAIALSQPRAVRMLWITAAWGACFVAIRWGLRDAPVLWFAALRALVAGAALISVASARHRPRPRRRPTRGLLVLLAATTARSS